MLKIFKSIALTGVASGFIILTTFAATTTDNVNLRSEPTTASMTYGVVENGTQVDVLDNDGQWSKVQYNGNTGYIRNDFLANNNSENYIYTTDNVHLRAGEGTDTTSYGIMPVGTKLTLLSKGDTWAKVQNGTQIGFVHSDYLGDLPTQESNTTNISEQVTEQTVENTYLYTTSNVNLRKGTNTDMEIIKVVGKNTTVTLLENIGDWSKIMVDGVTGYVSNDYLVDFGEMEKKATTTANVNLRSDSSTSSNIITTISTNTDVDIIEEYEEFNKVEVNGTVGYIANDYLDTGVEYVDGLPVITEKEVVEMGNATTGSVSSSAIEDLSWQEIKNGNLFPIGVDAKVVDLYTGKVYYVRSFSNGNHADVEPVSSDDTATMKATFGGSWSWDVRPVLVTINGRSFAGSINGQPHGGGVNSSNSMSGQVCIHFRGSYVHNGNSNFAALHQRVAKEALSLAQ